MTTFRTLTLLAWLGTLVLPGCSSKGGGSGNSGNGGATNGAGTTGTTPSAGGCLNLVNGKASSDYPAVVRLLSKPDSHDVGICSGTFISSTAVITAAHCLDGTPSGGLYLVGGTSVAFKDPQKSPFTGAVQSTKAFTYGAYGETGDPNDATVTGKDTAIVLFPAGSTSEYMTIGGSLPPIGTTVTSIGYGLTTLSTASPDPNYDASKHIGTTKIVPSEDSVNVFVGGVTAQQSADAGGSSVIDSFGDSGSPMIYNNTVVATLSNGGDGADAQGLDVWYITFVDINSAQTKSLIALANQNGANIAAPGTPATVIAAKNATAVASTCSAK